MRLSPGVIERLEFIEAINLPGESPSDIATAAPFTPISDRVLIFLLS
jgi:hypothetical protein